MLAIEWEVVFVMISCASTLWNRGTGNYRQQSILALPNWVNCYQWALMASQASVSLKIRSFICTWKSVESEHCRCKNGTQMPEWITKTIWSCRCIRLQVHRTGFSMWTWHVTPYDVVYVLERLPRKCTTAVDCGYLPEEASFHTCIVRNCNRCPGHELSLLIVKNCCGKHTFFWALCTPSW
jgi:hypothetical protein